MLSLCQPEKYKKLSTAFGSFLKCFYQFPRILAHLFVSFLNILINILIDVHQNAKIVVLCLFMVRYQITFQKTIFFILFFTFILRFVFLLENSPFFSYFFNRKCLLLGFLFFAFHSITFVPITNEKYHFRAQIWLLFVAISK